MQPQTQAAQTGAPITGAYPAPRIVRYKIVGPGKAGGTWIAGAPSQRTLDYANAKGLRIECCYSSGGAQ